MSRTIGAVSVTLPYDREPQWARAAETAAGTTDLNRLKRLRVRIGHPRGVLGSAHTKSRLIRVLAEAALRLIPPGLLTLSNMVERLSRVVRKSDAYWGKVQMRAVTVSGVTLLKPGPAIIVQAQPAAIWCPVTRRDLTHRNSGLRPVGYTVGSGS